MSSEYGCRHVLDVDGSTLVLMRYSGKENGVHDLWCVGCKVCGCHTDFYITIGKAKAMAAKEQFVENVKRKPISRYFHGV